MFIKHTLSKKKMFIKHKFCVCVYIRAYFYGPPTLFCSTFAATQDLGISKDIKLAYQYSGKSYDQKQNEELYIRGQCHITFAFQYHPSTTCYSNHNVEIPHWLKIQPKQLLLGLCSSFLSYKRVLWIGVKLRQNSKS